LRPKFVSRLAASVGLSVLFLVVYSGCNWITAQRHDVGTIYFEWERLIPFVPLMIVPYMSIDLFFVTAPFLCGTKRELATFTKRIAAAIIVAGICFLLFPLRFAFERPHTDGILGAIFDWFRGMDLPYNLCPSLHITLSVLLGATFARHLRGVLRSLAGIWFILIRASAVLTYQHHVMDVVGGFALAGYCLYFIRETPVCSPVVPNRGIGLRYLAGAAALIAAAVGFWPWGILFLWPALSLGIVAGAYFRVGPAIFRKVDGLVPWSTCWALGPCLFGQHLSRLYYMRQCRVWDQVTPQVWIGRVLDKSEAAQAVGAGVTAVLDLTAEFSEPRAFRNVHYRNVPVLDLTAPTIEPLEEIVRFIGEQSKTGVVYVHCKIGYSRSAAAVIAWLLDTGKVESVAEGVALLRQVRPSIVIRPEIQTALTEFESRLSATMQS
jgi:protein-tyrosine phosphatase